LEDANKFEKDVVPRKIFRYENEISMDPKTKKNDYLVRVWFETDKKDELLYKYSIAHDEKEGCYCLDKSSFFYAGLENQGA